MVRLALKVSETPVAVTELVLAVAEGVAELIRLAAPVVLIERIAFGAESDRAETRLAGRVLDANCIVAKLGLAIAH